MKLLVKFVDIGIHRVLNLTSSFRAGLSLAVHLQYSPNVISVSYLGEHNGDPSWYMAWERDINGEVRYSKRFQNIMITHGVRILSDEEITIDD